jgi:hypothetical protein
MEVPELWIRATSDGLVIGPFTKDQVRQMGRAGLINHESSVRPGEMGRWHPASAVKGLLPDRPVATSVPRAPSPAVGAAPIAAPVPGGVKPAKESTPKATISKSATETPDAAPRSGGAEIRCTQRHCNWSPRRRWCGRVLHDSQERNLDPSPFGIAGG